MCNMGLLPEAITNPDVNAYGQMITYIMGYHGRGSYKRKVIAEEIIY